MPQSNIIPPHCHITTFSRQNNNGWEPTMSFLTSAPAMPCCSKVATSRGPNCSSSSWPCAIKVTQTSNYAKLLWNPPLFFSWKGITCTIPATSCACCIAAAILLCASWSETDMVYFCTWYVQETAKFYNFCNLPLQRHKAEKNPVSYIGGTSFNCH